MRKHKIHNIASNMISEVPIWIPEMFIGVLEEKGYTTCMLPDRYVKPTWLYFFHQLYSDKAYIYEMPLHLVKRAKQDFCLFV